ncbi:MAG: DUF2752 domain-containing protein [Mycobacterium sp.]
MEPSPTTSHTGTRYATIGGAAVLVGALTYIGVRDPHAPGFGFPTCPFHVMTGWYCPGCGGIRMTHDVLNGDFSAALVDNAFLLVGLPVLALWLLMRRRSGKRGLPVLGWVTITVAAVAWTVVRNLPGFPLVPTFIGG